MAKSWKDALLSSGLPLEHDVKEYLDKRGCIASFEYSYLRPDESRNVKQFSYDIDASLVQPPHYVNFMVECKYRHPSVLWVFVPDAYGGPEERGPNEFMHASDHFVRRIFGLDGTIFPRRLGPCCSKGVEVTSEGANEKTIQIAIAQLAFGFASQLADMVEHQVRELLPGEWIYHNVPVIVTTAPLHRLRAGVSLEAIRAADNVGDVADQVDLVVVNYQPGIELKTYNAAILRAMREQITDDVLASKLSTFTKSLDHLFEVLANNSPRALVVVSISRGWSGMDILFQYVNELLRPSPELIAEIKAEHERIRAVGERLMRKRTEVDNAPNKALQPTSRARKSAKAVKKRRAARS